MKGPDPDRENYGSRTMGHSSVVEPELQLFALAETGRNAFRIRIWIWIKHDKMEHRSLKNQKRGDNFL